MRCVLLFAWFLLTPAVVAGQGAEGYGVPDDGLRFDGRITVEGVATALGVLGAATGYLINLIVGWRRYRRDERYRGTRLLILDLLQEQLWNGRTLEDLHNAYASHEASQKRREYHAWDPKKLDRIHLARELKDLQLQFLIDLVDQDKYRIRLNPTSAYDLRKINEAKIAATLQSPAIASKMRQITVPVTQQSTSAAYEMRDAFALLLGLGDEASKKIVLDALDSKDPKLATAAASALGKYVVG